MLSTSYSAHDFQKDIRQLLSISTMIGDAWELIECAANTSTNTTTTDEPVCYLRKQIKLSVKLADPIVANDDDDDADGCVLQTEDESSTLCNSNETILLYDFHVVYQPSYAVPLLCFNAYKPSGSMLTLFEAWTLFDPLYLPTTTTTSSDKRRQQMVSILTEMDHPRLFRPFLTLHPCRTAELLNSLPDSRNKVISFLSTVGRAVNLHLDPQYGAI